MQSSVELTQDLVRFKTSTLPAPSVLAPRGSHPYSRVQGSRLNSFLLGMGGPNWSHASVARLENCRLGLPDISIPFRSVRNLGPPIRWLLRLLTANSMGAAHPT